MGMPYPMTDGASLRVIELARELRKRHQVDFFFLTSRTERLRHLHVVKNIFSEVGYNIGQDKRSFWLKRKPLEYLDAIKFRRKVDEWVKRRKIDIIHCHYSRTANMLGGRGKVASVFDMVDSPGLYHKRDRERIRDAGPLRRIKHQIDKVRIHIFEKRMMSKFDVTVVVSREDQAYLQKISPSSKVFCIPNGVDAEKYRIATGADEASDVGFFGNMYFPPNYDAMLFFCYEILPIIHKSRPETKMLIVGRKPTKEVEALARMRNVVVTGEVEDIRPYVEQMGVVVMPFRLGAGIKNKVLEAFAMERPVVSTDRGIEAIDAEPGKHLLVANEPTRFAEAVLFLLGNKALRKSIGEDARKFVLDKYGWAKAAGQYEDVYRIMKNSLQG
jgi:glycosyltransferase involved in cell wall biosynthesis